MADKQYKLAFDVSTKSTGYALLDENNYIVASGEIKTTSDHPAFATRMAVDLETIEQKLNSMNGVLTYLKGGHDQYQQVIDAEMHKAVEKKLTKGQQELIKDKCKQGTKAHEQARADATQAKKDAWENMDKIELIVVIESNKIQKSQDVKQKLDLYVGMWLGSVVSYLNVLCPFFIKSYVLSSPTEWRNKAYGYLPERKEAKALAIENANSMLKEQGQKREVAGDDEAEAIIIATVADGLRDIATVYTQKQTKAKRITQLKNNLVNAERYVAKYSTMKEQKQKAGKDLQKSQQTVLDNNLKKVEQINKEIKRLNNL